MSVKHYSELVVWQKALSRSHLITDHCSLTTIHC